MKTVTVDIAPESGVTYDVGIRTEDSTSIPAGSFLKEAVSGPAVQFNDLVEGNYEGIVRRIKADGTKGQWYRQIAHDMNCPDLTAKSISDITDTTAKLNFTKPVGVTTVEYKKEGGAWSTSTGTEVTITGLTAGVLYNVYVRPVKSALEKGRIEKLTFTTTGGVTATAISKVRRVCFNQYHTNHIIRFTILNDLIADGGTYRIRLKSQNIATHTVTADDTLLTVITSLFNQVIGIPTTIVVNGTTASFDFETYSKSFTDGQFYLCTDNIDESVDYSFDTV